MKSPVTLRTGLLGGALIIAIASAGAWYATRKPVPIASTALPGVQILPAMKMPGLDRERILRVYTPPGYANSDKRYPVLYMHDGQNLFDAATSYAGEWGVDETLDRLAREHHLEVIVVGIDNGAEKRMLELTAWENPEHAKGEGRQYMEFVVAVVKPYIDAHYRTQPDRAHTAIMGSSLGGLISHYAIYEYPKVFGKAGLFSPSYWYAPAVDEFTTSHSVPPGTRLYFYAGGKEDEHMVGNMQHTVDLVRKAGVPAEAISVHVVETAAHNETAWRAEFPLAVEWLFREAE